MYLSNNTIHFSASDVSSHIGCAHLTLLKLMVAKGELKKPFFESPTLDVLRLKGEEFERDFLNNIKAEGKTVVEIARDNRNAEADTLEAMKSGVEYIYQARLRHGIWYGWADFLVKTNQKSNLGDWSYEVMDTKLAKDTKAGSVLQICLYSFILEKIQGFQPEYMHIKTPAQQESYRVNDFMAYFRLVQKRLQEAVDKGIEVYPEPVMQCDVCDWWERCNRTRREDDHLSFIAGMGSSQIREVRKWEVDTLESMATLPIPLSQKPSKGSPETFVRLREQARVQYESRVQRRPIHEVLELKPDFGLYKLPEPTDGDVFFDFEGDPFVGTTGREYLFGWVYKGIYHHLWATTDAEEKKAFEDFVDQMIAIRQQYPGMHIYHFAPYEPAALKRLMGKYVTRENEIDTLLRGGVFIDLHAVIKQSIRAGVESYSLKELEKFHLFTRKRDLRLVGKEKMMYECLLEAGTVLEAPQETVDVVRDYNEDDCRSTESLRNWLEHLRSALVDKGEDIPRPVHQEGEASERVTDHQQRIKPLYDALMNGIPFERKDRNEEQQSKWLLANMLDWYRREQKSFWWEYFRLRELPNEDLMDERVAIAFLTYTGDRRLVKKSVMDKYRFPVQETEIREGDSLKSRGDDAGTVENIDVEKGEIWIRRGLAKADLHPDAVFTLDLIKSDIKEASIIRLAESVVGNGIKGKGRYKAGRDLLLRAHPSVGGPFLKPEDPQATAVNWAKALDEGVLPVQGPPGSGKSHTAANMILELLKMGKKIGITALSHKVIHGLMDKVQKTADNKKQKIAMVQKVREESADPRWEETTDNGDVLELLRRNKVQIAAGTPFMWSRPDFFESVDVMFVDEAGQLSLIDTLALSQSAKNLVLLGDPQQLKQPQKGSHPEGTELSALEHILQGQKTIHEEQGVFLDKTWRLHPAICDFTSELFYESRLIPKPENENQRLEGKTRFASAGIFYESVEHEGNKNCSEEEVARITSIIKELTQSGVVWNDKDNNRRKLTVEDIMVIAPYNAQVHELTEALSGAQNSKQQTLSEVPRSVRVGTVDKFQGQEAPVVIFSMATSSPEDAPRGMEFLYSLERLNVAVSRAKAVFILVASPKLFEPDCRSPHQMKLANALCRLKEMAVVL